MKTLVNLFIGLIFLSKAFGQPVLTIEELKSLDNTSWTGNLMYKNYGDNSEVNLRTSMQIKIKGTLILRSIQYTDEPSANFNSKIALKKNGQYFGKERIIEKNYKKDSTLVFATEYKGLDDDRPAVMTTTYELNSAAISITKQVKYTDTAEKLIRNKYTYKRVQ